jgi:hypothetical protein
MAFGQFAWNLLCLSDFVHGGNAVEGSILTWGRVSEVDLMSPIYPLSVHRRIERQWAERIKSLRQTRGKLVLATERTVQRVFNNTGPPIPVHSRSVVQRQQLDRSQPRD